MKGINSKEPIVKICLDNIKVPCNVLSFGIDHNFVFDDFMLSKGCRVWSFDPSMRGNYSRGKNHKFFSVGIGAKDEMTTDKSTFIERDDSREVKTFETKTLSTIMHEMNIDFVDIIRLDTEGAEWRFFDSWDFSKIGQLLLEIHMYFDLNSRVNNCLFAKIEKPDDELMFALILKNFSDRQIVIDKKLIDFIIKRIDRSYSKISEFIYKIDEISLKKKNQLI